MNDIILCDTSGVLLGRFGAKNANRVRRFLIDKTSDIVPSELAWTVLEFGRGAGNS